MTDIRIPADSILALRRTLVAQVGAETAARALQEAGYAAGDALYRRLVGPGDGAEDALAATPTETFWDRLAALFRELGWGSVAAEDVHPGVGALVARDWFEADPSAGRTSCYFTTGVLANLLGRIAEHDVAVLEVDCDGADERCRKFLFGGGPALDALYGAIREGETVETAIAGLR